MSNENEHDDQLPDLDSFENDSIAEENLQKTTKSKVGLIALVAVLGMAAASGTWLLLDSDKLNKDKQIEAQTAISQATEDAGEWSSPAETSGMAMSNKDLSVPAAQENSLNSLNVLSAEDFNSQTAQTQNDTPKEITLASESTKDQLKDIDKLVRQAISEELESHMKALSDSNSAASNDELQKALDQLQSNLEVKINEASVQSADLAKFNFEELIEATAKETVRNYKSSLMAEIREDKPDYSDEEYSDFTEDRVRMQGFKVVKTSKDGTVSIIKTHTSNIIALFEGEWIKYKGASFKVEKVAHDGHLLHLGSKYFIDSKMDKVTSWSWKNKNKKAIKEATTTKGKPKPVPGNAVAKPKEPTEVQEGKKTTATVTIKNNNAVTTAKNWNLVAVVGESYLLLTPKGQFVKVKTGDKLAGLGVVKGVNAKGNLRIGRYRITKK